MNRGKIEQKLIVHILSNKIVAAVYKNINAIVHSPNGDTDLFDNVFAVLQGHLFEPYLFILFPDYVFRKYIDQIK